MKATEFVVGFSTSVGITGDSIKLITNVIKELCWSTWELHLSIFQIEITLIGGPIKVEWNYIDEKVWTGCYTWTLMTLISNSVSLTENLKKELCCEKSKMHLLWFYNLN